MTAEMERVTICIPAYNAARTIRETLKSLINQTYNNLEIIVSNNHSTDNTALVVKEFSGQGVKLVDCPFPLIKTGSLLDNCYSSGQNWNSLLNLGGGNFIGIYHADDTYEPEIVQKQIDFMNSYKECSAVFSMLRYMDSEGVYFDSKWKSCITEKYLFLNQAEFIDILASHRHFFSSSGVMLRRDSWRKAGKFDPIQWGQHADTEFWIRIAGIGPVGIINEPLVNYRISSTQDTAGWKVIYAYEHIPFLKIMDYYLVEKKFKNVIKKRSLQKLECIRLKEDIRIARNWILEGNEMQAMTRLKPFSKFSITELFHYLILNEKRFILNAFISKFLYYSLKWHSRYFSNIFIKLSDIYY